MFSRLIGRKKEEPPPPSLGEMQEKVDKRGEGLDAKIQKLEVELRKYREQIKRTRPGPSQNLLKQRALKVLKQKKMYEDQRDKLMSQSFNMEQTVFATESLESTIATVASMKHAQTAMKQQFKKIDIDEVETLHDDMEDLLDQSNEVQDALSRCYDIGDVVDEDDLEAELDALGDELEALDAEEEPSYLTAAVPTAEPGEPVQSVTESGGLDLPAVPQQTLS